DHRGRQHALGLAKRLEVVSGDAAALLGEVFEPEAVGGDERHLGRREEHREDQTQYGQPDEAHAAASFAGFFSATSTSTIRVRSTFSTVSCSSAVSARSARRGTRPKRSRTQPPTVS